MPEMYLKFESFLLWGAVLVAIGIVFYLVYLHFPKRSGRHSHHPRHSHHRHRSDHDREHRARAQEGRDQDSG